MDFKFARDLPISIYACLIKQLKTFPNHLEYVENDPQILCFRGYCYEKLVIIDKACEEYYKSNSISTNDSSNAGLLQINCKK